MLKYRLIFGTLMTIAFVGIILLSGRFDGSMTPPGDDKPFRGAAVAVLVALLIIPGLFEISKLAASKGIKILLPVSIPASILLVTSSYWLPRLMLTDGFQTVPRKSKAKTPWWICLVAIPPAMTARTRTGTTRMMYAPRSESRRVAVGPTGFAAWVIDAIRPKHGP